MDIENNADIATCRRWLRARVIELVTEEYAGWAARREWDSQAAEPSISVGHIADYLRQAWLPFEFRYDADRAGRGRARFDHECRNALESGRAKGLLGSSTGTGFHGREARCYEPAGE